MANTNNSINNTIQNNSFSVNQNRVGIGTTFTISQTSNTAGSSANLLVKVGGTSGGDAFTTYKVTGNASCSEGNNTDTNQEYRIANSTSLDVTPAVKISSIPTSLGCINYPLQPAFFAYLSTTLVSAISQTVPTFIVFDTISYDQNNNYSTSSGLFTAPIAGFYYFFSVSTMITTPGAQAPEVRYIFTVVSTLTAGYRPFKTNPTTSNSADDNRLTLAGEALISLNAGDTVQMQIFQLDGTNPNDTLLGGSPSTNFVTYFQGYLVL